MNLLADRSSKNVQRYHDWIWVLEDMSSVLRWRLQTEHTLEPLNYFCMRTYEVTKESRSSMQQWTGALLIVSPGRFGLDFALFLKKMYKFWIFEKQFWWKCADNEKMFFIVPVFSQHKCHTVTMVRPTLNKQIPPWTVFSHFFVSCCPVQFVQ